MNRAIPAFQDEDFLPLDKVMARWHPFKPVKFRYPRKGIDMYQDMGQLPANTSKLLVASSCPRASCNEKVQTPETSS
jgi:hypothetical protein